MCYWRTDIQRSGWRVPGALNMDDEEDADEILDDLNILDGMAPLNNGDNNAKKVSSTGIQGKPKAPNPPNNAQNSSSVLAQ
jgi:hypothetical protein